MLKVVLNECLDNKLLPQSEKNMNHLLFTFKNINVKVRILGRKNNGSKMSWVRKLLDQNRF